MTEREDDEQSDHKGIPAEMLQFLDAFAASVERANARDWASNQEEFTDGQALELVKKTLGEQLAERETFTSRRAQLLRGAIAIEEVFDNVPPTEDDIELAVKSRLDDYETFQAIRTLAGLPYGSQSPMLSRFRSLYMAGLIEEPKKPRGPSRSRDLHRNMIIASQIRQLEKVGISPTRSSATKKRQSGCDVVADALSELGHNIDYSAVEKVWKNRDQRPQPYFLAEVLRDALMEILPPIAPSD